MLYYTKSRIYYSSILKKNSDKIFSNTININLIFLSEEFSSGRVYQINNVAILVKTSGRMLLGFDTKLNVFFVYLFSYFISTFKMYLYFLNSIIVNLILRFIFTTLKSIYDISDNHVLYYSI